MQIFCPTKRFILLGACILCFGTLYAQIDSVSVLNEAVISGTKGISPTRQSSPVQIMQRQGFDRLGLHEVSQAVRSFAGVDLRDYGGIGGLKTVSVRSLGSQHTTVSYDGISVNEVQGGQVDIGRFSLDNVELISLQIGPSDNIFQPAKLFASAGNLEIRTSLPDFSHSPVRINAIVSAASFGTYSPSLWYGQKLSSKWGITVSADWLTSKGDYPYTLTNGLSQTSEIRRNSDVCTIRSEVNIFGDLGSGGSISLKGNLFNSERGLPGSVVLYNQSAAERLWDKNRFAQFHYQNRFGKKWQLQGNLKYNYSWNKYRDSSLLYQSGTIEDRYTQNEYYSSVSALYSPSATLSISVAEDFIFNSLEATTPGCPDPVRYSSLSAVAAQYKTPRLTATASLLGTFITEELATGTPAPDRWRLSPSAAISYRLFAEDNLRIRASFRDGFRVPTFNDLYYSRVGNRSLKPEKASQYNIGLTWDSSSKSTLSDHLSVTVDGYYNKVKDKIVARPTMFIWSMLNVGEVEILGADISISSSISLPKAMSLLLSATYSYKYAVDVTDPTAKNYKHQIPYTSRNSGNLSLSWINKWLNMSYLLTGVGERFSLPQNIETNKIPGYFEHTLTASRTFYTANVQIRLQAECVNILDTNYQIIQYYPMPGRTFRLSLKFIY